MASDVHAEQVGHLSGLKAASVNSGTKVLHTALLNITLEKKLE